MSCSLFPQADGEPPYVPWAELLEALEVWRAEARFQWCSFLYKTPGLRLRFYGAHLGERLEPVLDTWLIDCEARNLLRGFRFTAYEPEVHRFGGPVGMALAHEHFDQDSRLAMRYAVLSLAERSGLPPHLLSLSVMNDLFAKCLDDAAEVWDVWRRLAQALGVECGAVDNGALDQARLASTRAEAYTAMLPPRAGQLLEAALDGNETLAAKLRGAATAGRLTVGTRAWLVGACVFHWNRLGLVASDLAPSVAAMVRLMGPDPIVS